MKPATLYLLGGLSAGAAAIAGVLALRQPQPATAPLAAGQLMFPGLVDRLQGARRVEITGRDGTLVLARDGEAAAGVWGDAGRDGYPVQQGRVREMFSGLTELRLTEPRTADPAQLAALNLNEPGPDSTALRLSVQDGQGTVIAEAILGRRRVRMAGNVPEAIYVRRPNETQTWLAEGTLRVDAERNLWLDRDLFDVKRARVAAAEFRQGEAVVRLSRSDPAAERLEVDSPPEGWRGDETKIDDVARALEWLTFEDVLARRRLDGAQELGTALWVLWDGTRITARVLEHEGARHAIFDVAWQAPAGEAPTGGEHRAPETARTEAEAAAARLGAWAYRLPDWKLATLLTSAESMKAAE